MPDDLDWSALADPAATTAVYMGKAVLGPFAERLVAAGIDPATPAIIVENATRPDEVVLHASVSTMAATLAEARLEGPCIMLIGAALGEAASSDDGATSVAAKVRTPA